MVDAPRRAYLLWNCEPEYDCADPAATLKALKGADTVIAFSAYRNGALEYADAILPITPFTETAGTFVSGEGRVQGFNGVVPPLGEARPGWKVLRVLGNQLGLAGFDYESPEAVRADALPADVAGAAVECGRHRAGAAGGRRRRRRADRRRADPFLRPDRAPRAVAAEDGRCQAAAGQRERAHAGRLRPAGRGQGAHPPGRGGGAARMRARRRLPDGVVRVPAAHASTSTLGADVRAADDGAGLMLDAFVTAAASARSGLAGRVDAGQDRRGGAAAAGHGRLPDAVGTQADRLDAHPAGPNRVGYGGLLQPWADAVKLMFKEVIAPTQADKPLYFIAPALVMMPALAAWAVIPFGTRRRAGRHQRRAAVRDGGDLGRRLRRDHRRLGVELEVRVPGRDARLGADGELRTGDGLRAGDRAAGGRHAEPDRHRRQPEPRHLRRHGAARFLSWNWLPLLPLFVIYVISAIAETNRHPFDVVEGESEIVAGHMVEYSGMSFAVFFLAEYANMILLSTLATIMFLGGWAAPVNLEVLLGVDFPAWVDGFPAGSG
jgi:hypothetical protein